MDVQSCVDQTILAIFEDSALMSEVSRKGSETFCRASLASTPKEALRSFLWLFGLPGWEWSGR